MRYVILLIFIIWALWASFSTGGLTELKQLNPQYAHPNKSVPYLIGKLNCSKSSGFWDSSHVEQCSWYMPNWAKAERCVRERINCELKSPKKKDSFGEYYGDIFSAEFMSCWKDKKPFMGPMEWLRASRSAWRFGILMSAVWLKGGWDTTGAEAQKWETENKGWLKPLDAWMVKGE